MSIQDEDSFKAFFDAICSFDEAFRKLQIRLTRMKREGAGDIELQQEARQEIQQGVPFKIGTEDIDIEKLIRADTFDKRSGFMVQIILGEPYTIENGKVVFNEPCTLTAKEVARLLAKLY